jgi:23S rRNA pseudouridine2605 synthase
MKPARLQKYLASAGAGSRRYCEELIAAGRVTVNGRVAQVGQSVEPGVDKVCLRGKEVRPASERVVIMVNKPRDVLSTCHRGKEEGYLITEIVQTEFRLFPVGRLDRESEGLLLLTNDGELALRLTHPRYETEKEYEVELDKVASPELVAALSKGIVLEDGPAKPARVERAGAWKLRMVLTEGRKREVRRMLAALGHSAVRLVRVRIGGLRMEGLKTGEWRRLTEAEVDEKLVRGPDEVRIQKSDTRTQNAEERRP